jgi:hypothetical protein
MGSNSATLQYSLSREEGMACKYVVDYNSTCSLAANDSHLLDEHGALMKCTVGQEPAEGKDL